VSGSVIEHSVLNQKCGSRPLSVLDVASLFGFCLKAGYNSSSDADEA